MSTTVCSINRSAVVDAYMSTANLGAAGMVCGWELDEGLRFASAAIAVLGEKSRPVRRSRASRDKGIRHLGKVSLRTANAHRRARRSPKRIVIPRDGFIRLKSSLSALSARRSIT